MMSLVPDHLRSEINTCPLCSQIIAAAQTPFDEEFEKLVNVQDLDSIDCKDHDDLVKHELKQTSNPKSILGIRKPQDSSRIQTSMTLISGQNDDDPEIAYFPWGFHLQQSDDNQKDAARGIIIDPERINISTLREWKDECLKSHGAECENPYPIYNFGPTSPLWLVDTKQQCIVGGQPSMTYVTLSYVWGKKDTLRCVKANLESLQQAGALSRPEFEQSIPNTIRDAMCLVSLLHERYLWVDSLCIVQDDDMAKPNELNKMATIYAKSCFTIIAADAEDSWEGLKGISQPRKIVQTVIPLGSKGTLVEELSRREMDTPYFSHQTYYRRGWCFQEHMFARRRLIFDRIVRWQCQHATWYEDMVPVPGRDEQPKPTSFVESSRLWLYRSYPCLVSYGSLIAEYSEKELTYPEDMLPAFSGILTNLSRTFSGGFLSGLPVLFFDIALCWKITGHGERRKSTNNRGSTTCAPSWSCFGWQGSTTFPDELETPFVMDQIRSSPIHTVPMTTWYAMDSPSSTNRRIVQSHWFRYKRDSQDLTIPLPIGWSRHEYKPEAPGAGYKRTEPVSYYYMHSRIPSVKFNYPLPIMEATSTPAIPSTTPFLYCRTSHAMLYADGEKVTPEDKWHIECSLRDIRGNWTGILWAHNQDDVKQFSRCPWPGQKVELVAINRSHCPNDNFNGYGLQEWFFNERPKDTPLYEFYHVLWVEWKDGVAYRKGFGRVVKEAWDRTRELSDLDLIL